MEQELRTVAFVLALLRVVGLFPWQKEEVVFQMGVHHFPRLYGTWIKPLSFGQFLPHKFGFWGSRQPNFCFVLLHFHLENPQRISLRSQNSFLMTLTLSTIFLDRTKTLKKASKLFCEKRLLQCLVCNNLNFQSYKYILYEEKWNWFSIEC